MTTKEFIKYIGLTQREFAELCGVSLRMVQYWCQWDWLPDYAHKILEMHVQIKQQDNKHE